MLKIVFKKDSVQQKFESWLNITNEPSDNQSDMERLYELAIEIVIDEAVLDEELFVSAVKEHFQITATHHRGVGQKLFRKLKDVVDFCKYLKTKHII